MNKNKNNNNNNKSKVVNEDNVGVDSFSSYKASHDDKTRVKDGEKEIESFHLYKEDDK
jgi:hypothetical protein